MPVGEFRRRTAGMATSSLLRRRQGSRHTKNLMVALPSIATKKQSSMATARRRRLILPLRRIAFAKFLGIPHDLQAGE
jgi:hypothetical protein